MEATTVNSTRRMVWTALLSAVAAVLMYIDMAVPVFPRFLKLDLSDLPALVAAFASDADLYILDEPTSELDPLMESVFPAVTAPVVLI